MEISIVVQTVGADGYSNFCVTRPHFQYFGPAGSGKRDGRGGGFDPEYLVLNLPAS